VQTHDIGLRQHLADFAPSKVGPIGDGESDLIECDYSELERQCYLGHAPSDPTKTYDSDRLAGQLKQGCFPEGEIHRSRALSGASRLTVKSNVPKKLQHQRKSEFRHGGRTVGREYW
jgi:hypothetical protein